MTARGAPPPLASVAHARSLEPQALARRRSWNGCPLNATSAKRVLLNVAIAAATAIAARADQPSALTGTSAALSVEHIRAIGQQLGIPRTLIFGEPPPHSLAVADFDGDGHADIIVGAKDANEVIVLLGNAARPFAGTRVAGRSEWPSADGVAEVGQVGYSVHSSALSSTTTVAYRTNGSAQSAKNSVPYFAVVSDFDADGTIDVAIASGSSNELLVYSGGEATKSQRIDRIPLKAAAVALGVGDFDGDNAADLVVADNSTSLTLLFGSGSGSFGKTRSVDIGIKPASHGLAVSDIDGDGIADVVVLGESSTEVDVFLGNGSGGLNRYASTTVDVPLASSFERVSDSPPSALARSAAADYQGIASLILNPAAIAGGSGVTSTGTVTLNAPAPAGGVVVQLNSSNIDLAASVPSITVPAGATTGTFTIGTNQNYRRYSGLAFNITISATHGTTTRSAILSVSAQPQPGPLSSFDAQNEGDMCFGVGVRRTASGYVPEFGSAGNLFTCKPPKDPVGQDGTCTFKQECSLGCEFRPPQNGFKFSDVCATTGPFPVAINPKLIVGGNPSVATLQLSAAAPANSSGILSSQTVLANTIPNLSTPIPLGATSAKADVLTARVNSPQFAPIDGSYLTPRADGSRSGRGGLSWLTLVSGTAPPFRLTSFNFDPSTATVQGGNTIFAIARMNQVAPAPEIASATMHVSSSNPAVASPAQPDISFVQGSSTASFAIQTKAVSQDTTVTFSATVGDTTLTQQLTVKATPAATSVTSFFVDPLQVIGGDTAIGTVVLNGAAPSGGAVVALQSGDTAVVTMPASVTIPAGSDRVSFTISTRPVAANTTVSLTATYGNSFAATSIMVLSR